MAGGKIVIFSAPSGAGKTTIVHKMLEYKEFNLAFSVSATSRAPRPGEENGKDYYFLSTEEFKRRIENNEFIEWVEVYKNQFYGTLRSEVERLFSMGKNVVFDVDVLGGLNIKKAYSDRSLSVFVKPPSIEELRNRLMKRGTETPDSLKKRLERAEFEISLADRFDVIIVNDDLQKAIDETRKVLAKFLL